MSSRAFLYCLATADDKNITILDFFEKFYILDAYLAQMKWYISIFMPIYYLSKYFNLENKSIIEFTHLGYLTVVF